MSITATEAARAFSDVLNRVAAGEELEITRNGAPVAVISPPRATMLAPRRARELIASAPMPDAEFADELRRARAQLEPPREPWGS